MQRSYEAYHDDPSADFDSEKADNPKNIAARLMRRTKQYGNEGYVQFVVASVLAIAETKDINWLKSDTCKKLLTAAGFDTEYLYSIINKKTSKDIQANYSLDNSRVLKNNVEQAKKEYEEGASLKELSVKYGVLVNTVRKAVTGCMASDQVLDKYNEIYPLFLQKYAELQSVKKVMRELNIPERAAFGLYQKMRMEKQL